MMRFTPAAKGKRQAQKEAQENGAETFVWPCRIHGDQAASDAQYGWCIGCRALVVEARQAKQAKAVAQLAEKHSTRAPKRLLGRRRKEALEAAAHAYQEKKKAVARTRMERMRAEMERTAIEAKQRRAAPADDRDSGAHIEDL